MRGPSVAEPAQSMSVGELLETTTNLPRSSVGIAGGKRCLGRGRSSAHASSTDVAHRITITTYKPTSS